MKKIIFRILKCVFAILIIISFVNIMIWYRENTKVKKIVDNVMGYLIVEGEEYEVDEKIKEYNKDIIGWIKVDNTNIDYPLVQGKDNEYYLNYDLDNHKNSAGWIFMDSKNTLDDQNIIIYGHHRRDGSMFGSIDNLFKNPKTGKILLIINGENRYYQIFSVYETEEIETYLDLNYDNFKKTIEKFKNKSKYDYKQNLSDIKQIITLSTCSNDNKGRIVVHAFKK